MSDFMDSTGLQQLVLLNPDGSIPVSAEDGGDGASGLTLLGQLVWEIRELRRVQCEATGQFFQEYPG